MNAVLAPTAAIHSRTALAMNSGPLSERTWPGTPRRMNRSDKTSMTSVELSLRSIRIARHSLVNSSMMLSMRNFLPLWGPALDEVIGPNMVWMLGPKPDARSVIQPEPASLRLFLRNLQPLPPPDALDTLGIHRPTLGPQHRRDPAIAIAAIPGGEPDDVGGQRLLICSAFRRLALCRTMLTENPAVKALRNGELHHDMVDAATATGRAQKFPEAASFRISFASVRSETALRSRSFSFSSSFKRFT